MTNLDQEKQYNIKLLRLLLTPSLFSGFIAIFVGLVFVLGVLVIFNYDNSGIAKQLTSFETSKPPPPLTEPGQNINPLPNTIQNTWPLLVIWGAIGLMAYFIIDFIVKIVNNVQSFEKELNYVHSKRDLMVRTTVEYLLLRLVAVLFWAIYARLFFKNIAPDCVRLIHEAASNLLQLQHILDAIFVFCVMVFCIYLHTVFLRLSFRRARLFSSV